jgi:hypothetical protein
MNQMKRTLQLVLVAASLAVFPACRVLRLQADSEVPFIDYYSASASAFIVERADGKDSQILTAFTPPPAWENSQPMVVVGPGWSPSGNWLAWTTDLPYGNRSRGRNVHLVHRSGGDWLALFDAEEARRINSLTWLVTRALIIQIGKGLFDDGSRPRIRHLCCYSPIAESNEVEEC